MNFQNKTDTIETTWAKPQFQEKLAITDKPSPPGTSKDVVKRPTGRRCSIPTSVMVHAAIKSQMLTARSSVSYAAIKKYIKQNYVAANIDLNNRVKYIKKYIISALEKGKLLRVKGRGVSGSFRLPPNEFKNIKLEKKKAVANKENPKISKNMVTKTIPESITKKQSSKFILFG